MNVHPLLTPRLRLRPITEADFERLYELYTHPLVEPWIGHHTREDAGVELSFQIAHQQRFGWSLWAVEELASGRLIGDCGLQPLAREGPEVELSYELDPERWGRGLATEAASAAVRHGLGELGMERIIAVVKPANAASRRVLEKAGLRPAGEREAYGEQMLVYEALARHPHG